MTVMTTEAGRQAAASLDREQNAEQWDRKIVARLRELGAHEQTSETKLKRLATSDPALRKLMVEYFIATHAPAVLLAAGYVPEVGEPGQPVRWHQPDDAPA
jgi:hypothetical protein